MIGAPATRPTTSSARSPPGRGSRSTSSPATATCSSSSTTRPARAGALHRRAGSASTSRWTNAWVRASTGSTRQYADFATLRGDASDGLPGVTGVVTRPRRPCSTASGHRRGPGRGRRPGLRPGPGPRGKISWPRQDYLTVAPQVVAVARDIDLGSPDTRLPSEPRYLARVAELFEVGHREPGAAADRGAARALARAGQRSISSTTIFAADGQPFVKP